MCSCGLADPTIGVAEGGMFACQEAAVVSQFNTVGFSKSDQDSIKQVEMQRARAKKKVVDVQETVSSIQSILDTLKQDLSQQEANLTVLNKLQADFDEIVVDRLQGEEEKMKLKDNEIKQNIEKLNKVLKNQKKLMAGFAAGTLIALALVVVVVVFVVKAVA